MKLARYVMLCFLLSVAPICAQSTAPQQNTKAGSEVQLGSSWTVDNSAAPLVKLSRTLRENTTARWLRITWNFVISQSGADTTVLYDRKRHTLKLYSKHYNENGFDIKHYLFSQTNDQTVHNLMEKYKDNDGARTSYDELAFFTRLTEFGAQTRDIGSRIVSYPQR